MADLCPQCGMETRATASTDFRVCPACGPVRTKAAPAPPSWETDARFTVEELREMAKREATKCPCCGRVIKVYRFRLGSYCRLLIWMYRNEDPDEGRWLYVPDAPVPEVWNGGGDYAKMRVFGLIERHPENPDPTKRSSGVWRLTDRGRLFLLGRSREPSHFFYEPPIDDGVLGMETETVAIQDALGEKFNYSALMRGEW